MAQTRTSKSVKNSTVALLMYGLTFFVSFFSRKVFIDYLGAEVLGLNSTLGSFLSLLNLAELGIGSAIAFTLYKPLHEKDQDTVNDIISLQGWYYRRVASVIILGSAVLMCFFPIIFSDIQVPLWYAYASFGTLLFSSMLGYFVNYPRIVLNASQLQYKLQYTGNIPGLIKLGLQMLAVRYLPLGFVWWLLLEIIFAVIISVFLQILIKKEFPNLKTDVRRGKELRKKYPLILKKIRQLFIHKIGGVALTQTIPVITYAYASLTTVTYYGNYMVIINGLSSVLGATFSGVHAGVGDLVAEGNMKKILSVFRELFSSRFVIISSFCYCFIVLSESFISLWLGKEYILEQGIVILIATLFFIRTTRDTVDAYINAYGLFGDIWSPLAEAAINILSSIALGYFFGLKGILGGVLISQLLIIFLWKPFYLYHYALHVNISYYALLYGKHLLVAVAAAFLTTFIIGKVPIDPSAGFLHFAAYGAITFICFFSFVVTALLLSEQGLRDFSQRIKRIIARK